MTKQTQVSSSSPKIASWLMIATYVVGAIGVFMGSATVSASTPSLTWATWLIVVGAGGLSFVRHSVFYRSDAARLSWASEQKNYFQIEVGLANGAWALVGLLAVLLSWGIVAEATVIMVFGAYLTLTAGMLVLDRKAARKWPQILGMGVFGVAQFVLAIVALSR